MSKAREVFINAMYFDFLQIFTEIMINNFQTSDKNRGSSTHWIHEVILCALYRGFGLFSPGIGFTVVLHHL